MVDSDNNDDDECDVSGDDLCDGGCGCCGVDDSYVDEHIYLHSCMHTYIHIYVDSVYNIHTYTYPHT